MKKSIVFLIMVALFIFNACDYPEPDVTNGHFDESKTNETVVDNITAIDNTETEEYIENSTDSSTEEVLSTSTTGTTQELPHRALQQNDLDVFLNNHQQIMLELGNIVLELDMQPVDSNTQKVYLEVYLEVYYGNGVFSYPHYKDENENRITFENDVEEKILSYYRTVFEETGYSPGIEARVTNGKRTVCYSFDAMDEAGYIVYMPDGYVKLTYPDPETTEILQKSEMKLEDNWYSYFL